MKRSFFSLRAGPPPGVIPEPNFIGFQRLNSRVTDLRIKKSRHAAEAFSLHPDRNPSNPCEIRENFPYNLRTPRTRPTHFLSLTVTKPNITGAIANVQREMSLMIKPLAVAVVPDPKHMSLSLLSVDTTTHPDAESRAFEVLQDVAASMRTVFIRFRGLGVFRQGEVLFVKTSPDLDFGMLHEFTMVLRRAMSTAGAGIRLIGNPHDNYTPYLTIAKTRPDHAFLEIPMQSYVVFATMEFGEESFSKIVMHRRPEAGEKLEDCVVGVADFATNPVMGSRALLRDLIDRSEMRA